MTYAKTLFFAFVFIAQVNLLIGFLRPVWNIAHMVNSISEIVPSLNDGANAIEADVMFNSKCQFQYTYHGFPCDCFRNCWRYAKAGDYLAALDEISNPESLKYHPSLNMVIFDLKISKLSDWCKFEAGVDMAKKLYRYIFRSAWDISTSDIQSTVETYNTLNITERRWKGEGNANCLPFSLSKLYYSILIRNLTSNKYLDKVYLWTTDLKSTMRKALSLQVDGIMTNFPRKLNNVLMEGKFKKLYRLADQFDNV
ncbi:phospholipase D LsSicTox-alphaIA1-like [Centruroides sculpturatus]|uniref:phospholipase D LsSicTox-alphaIA1-like n=1 Tax=Centruroides sculpturatus TaxID=218467 RepID=UPI000C6CD9BE|nr:phospholipase D LsSicTox-alphaIA1-like [Centruroides sculpturatus]